MSVLIMARESVGPLKRLTKIDRLAMPSVGEHVVVGDKLYKVERVINWATPAFIYNRYRVYVGGVDAVLEVLGG